MMLLQGDTYGLAVRILNKRTRQPIDISIVSSVEFMIGDIRKMYPEEVAFNDGCFIIPLTQQETLSLPDVIEYQSRVRFLNGTVRGTLKKRTLVAKSISKEVLS